MDGKSVEPHDAALTLGVIWADRGCQPDCQSGHGHASGRGRVSPLEKTGVGGGRCLARLDKDRKIKYSYE